MLKYLQQVRNADFAQNVWFLNTCNFVGTYADANGILIYVDIIAYSCLLSKYISQNGHTFTLLIIFGKI